MRTIGRHWPTDRARGDRPAMCDYCSAMWPRSQLRRDQAGKLYCPNEGNGADEVELSQLNASAPPFRRSPDPGGRFLDNDLPAAGYDARIDLGPLTNPGWTTTYATIVDQYTIRDTLDGGATVHRADRQAILPAAPAAVSMMVRLKSGTLDWMLIHLGGKIGYINAATAAVVNSTLTTLTANAAADGWVDVACSTTATSGRRVSIEPAKLVGGHPTYSYQGDGTGTILVDHAIVEHDLIWAPPGAPSNWKLGALL